MTDSNDHYLEIALLGSTQEQMSQDLKLHHFHHTLQLAKDLSV